MLTAKQIKSWLNAMLVKGDLLSQCVVMGLLGLHNSSNAYAYKY